jgi:hypothetical protein
MSKVLPLFAAAPRLKIKVNDIDIAYAIGLNMNVSIDVVPVKILGQFEIASLEPTAYNPVTGTFRVIRLLNPTSRAEIKKAADTGKTKLLGTGATLAPAVEDAVASSSSSVLSQSYLHRHLDPTKVLISQTFDIELYLKIPKMTLVGGVVTAYTGDVEESFIKLQDCRVVGMDGEIAPGRLLEEPLSFQGLLAVNSSLGSGAKEGLDSVIKDNAIAKS